MNWSELITRIADGEDSFTLDNIRTHYSKPRNEAIARVLLNLGFANRLGSGIPRMIRLMREHTGREPEFAVTDAQFVVRLWSTTQVQQESQQ